MAEVPVKEAVLEFFRRKNIVHIFHLPGIHTLPLNQALEKSDISVFMGRHESNCAFMADGYARSSEKVGVIVVTPGPGLGNIVAPSMEAYGDGVPLLIIHIDSGPKARGKGMLHEIIDPGSIFSACTKAQFFIERPEEVPATFDRAYVSARSERCGPVLISIPHTLLEKEPAARPPQTLTARDPVCRHISCDPPSSLEEALQGKKRPIIVGGRALMRSGLSGGLEDLCRGSRIPLLTTTAAKGIIREDLPFAFGNVIAHGVARSILARSDVVIALGTRLRDADAKRRGVKVKDIIHIDVDDTWMGKNYLTSLGIPCPDLSLAIAWLAEVFRDRESDWDLDALKAQQAGEHKKLRTLPGFSVVELLRTTIPADTLTVWDLNLISYWAEYYFPVLERNTFFTPRGTSPIFYAVPAAIGAKIGVPERPCLCVTGDGSSLPGLIELATAKKYNIPVVFLVYNNSSYGILGQYMADRYHLHGAMDLMNPDFVKLARSFDVKALRVKTLDGLARVLRKQTTWTEPFLVEFSYPAFPPPWQI